MTEKLREAAQAVLDRWDSTDWKAAPTAEYMNRLRAALAAAPQPAPVDREALVEVIRDAIRPGICDTIAERAADALLARGLRLPGGETMAWAVVGEDGEVIPGSIYPTRDEAERVCDYEGERVVRVAIRVVEGGDDAA